MLGIIQYDRELERFMHDSTLALYIHKNNTSTPLLVSSNSGRATCQKFQGFRFLWISPPLSLIFSLTQMRSWFPLQLTTVCGFTLPCSSSSSWKLALW